MTMIDEDTLRAALHNTADTFDVSSDEAQTLFAQMRDDENESRVTHVLREPSRTRRAMMGAAALIIALAVGVPLALHQNAGPFKQPFIGGTPLSEKRVAPTSTGGLTVNHTGPNQGVVTSGTGFAATPNTPQRIESTGTIAITVAKRHIETALTKLASIVESDHGYVQSTQAATGSQVPRAFTNASIVLEVPQISFHHLVAQVQQVGHTTSLSTNSNNVTSQYVNYQARISALKVSLNQYLAIMTRATTITAILAVQAQINQIQSQIEQEQGQLNVLNHQTTYASLTVNVATPSHHGSTTKRSGLDKAFHDSVSGFVTGFEWLIRLAGPVLFALIALSVLSFAVRYAWRGIRRRRI